MGAGRAGGAEQGAEEAAGAGAGAGALQSRLKDLLQFSNDGSSLRAQLVNNVDLLQELLCSLGSNLYFNLQSLNGWAISYTKRKKT